MSRVVTAEEWIGLALIVAGVALWSIPAAVVVAGVLLTLDAASRRAARGGKADGDR